MIPPAKPMTSQSFSQPRRTWPSWGMSVSVHVILLVLIFAVWVRPRPSGFEPTRPGSIALAVLAADELKTDYLVEENSDSTKDFLTNEQLMNQSQLSTAEDGAVDFDSPPIVQSRNSLAESGQYPGNALTDLGDANSMLHAANNQSGQRAGALSAADKKRIADEQALVESRKPVGEPISLSVFGSALLTGRKFVFVIDQSDSMGTGGLGVLSASVNELTRELEKLQDYHRFQIVAYNEHVTTLGGAILLPATDTNKGKIQGFLSDLVAVGGTNHQGGLMFALSLEPDVVVMLSDGGDPGLEERQLNLIRRLVDGRTQIHCLQFGIGDQPPADDSFMRKLAEQNQGGYRYINVENWDENLK